MDVRDQLVGIRAAHAGCETLLLGDLESGTVFFAAASDSALQEDHDRLLAQASDLLAGSGAVALSAIPTEAIWLAPRQVRVFSRCGPDAAEAICGACRADVDTGSILTAIRVLAHTLWKGG